MLNNSLRESYIQQLSLFAWEQRKLGELVDRVVRKNTNNESTLPLTISAQYGLVDQITYFNNRVASRDVSNYYLVLNGEFAYNKSTSDGYPFGAVKRLDLYEKGVLSTLYIVFAPKKEQQIDSDYLTVFFDTDRWHKGVAERAAEGARNHGLLNISAEDFFDIDLSVPKDIVEQKQIGTYFRNLDNLITLHQCKCDYLIRLKCWDFSSLNKTAWEQRKLGEFGRATGGTSIESEFVEKGNYKVISIGSYSETSKYNDQGLRTNKTPKTESKILNKDNLTMILNDKTAAGNIIGRVLLIDADNSYVYNQRTERIEVYKEDFEPSFLYQLLNAENIRSKIIKASQGNTQIYVNWSSISELEYLIPKVKSEQKKIATILNNLDNLITLHQREF